MWIFSHFICLLTNKSLDTSLKFYNSLQLVSIFTRIIPFISHDDLVSVRAFDERPCWKPCQKSRWIFYGYQRSFTSWLTLWEHRRLVMWCPLQNCTVGQHACPLLDFLTVCTEQRWVFTGLQFSGSCMLSLKIDVALDTSQSSGVKAALREVI